MSSATPPLTGTTSPADDPAASRLPWVIAVVCVLLGWLTPAQVAITIALELTLAAHHARRRTLLSEGVIQKDRGTLSAGDRELALTAGRHLDAEERSFYGRNMQVAVTMVALMCAVLTTAFTGWSGLTPFAVAGWALWTATTLWAERRDFQRWASSDAPATADPTAFVNPAFLRAVVLFLATWFAVVIGNTLPDQGATRFAALLLLGADWLYLHGPAWRRARRVARDEARRPRPVHRRLPTPAPDWVPAPGWSPPPGWYGQVPGWEQGDDGSWRRTAEHPWSSGAPGNAPGAGHEARPLE